MLPDLCRRDVYDVSSVLSVRIHCHLGRRVLVGRGSVQDNTRWCQLGGAVW